MTESTETQAPPGHLPIVTPARVIAGLCLLTPFIGTLWVSSYAKAEPDLGGVPFFYWYQLMWVPISAILTITAYLLVRKDERNRKALKAGDGQS
jgi:Protein of unknown function (DUF3311).